MNCQSVKPKLNELSRFLLNHKIHIALLTETWLHNKISVNFPNYHCYRKDRETISNSTKSYGGVAILVEKSIPHSLIKFRNTNEIESIFVEINSNDIPFKPRTSVTFGGFQC